MLLFDRDSCRAWHRRWSFLTGVIAIGFIAWYVGEAVSFRYLPGGSSRPGLTAGAVGGVLMLYLGAFVLAALAWLGWSGPLNRASFGLIVVAGCVHTFALVSRIYISGRPPVTNLYSSAIFIGWAAMLFGLGLELIYRMGIGNVIASVIGFGGTLLPQQQDGEIDLSLRQIGL